LTMDPRRSCFDSGDAGSAHRVVGSTGRQDQGSSLTDSATACWTARVSVSLDSSTVERRGSICPSCGAVYTDRDRTFCHRDGSPLRLRLREPRHGLPIGHVVAGRYELTGVLGSGAMGTVYTASRSADGRAVAVKVIRPDITGDAATRRRFLREAQAASRAASPNIVTVYDYGHDRDGTDYIVMERLEGESLGDLVRRVGVVAPLSAVELALGIVAALRAAHAAGVIHRDLKPDNVFVTRNGTVKVLDFGIAKMFGESDFVTRVTTLSGAGRVTGTPLYMSPEVSRRAHALPASDYYALGVMLHEMLVGEPPFTHESALLVLGMHIRSRPQPVTQLRPSGEIPADLEALILDLLAKDPTARPGGADVYGRLRDIRRAMKSAALATEKSPRSPPVAPAVLPAKRLVPWIVAALVVASAALLITWWSWW